MTLREFITKYGEQTLDMELHELHVQGVMMGRAIVFSVDHGVDLVYVPALEGRSDEQR